MKFQKRILSCFFILFFVLFSFNVVFANETPAMPLIENGTVSGDAHIETSNPWKTSGDLEYIIPNDVSEIKSVNLIINSYSGSGAPTYALYSNITLNTPNGFEIISYEDLYSDISMTNDPLVYQINNHTTKQYSDYQSIFNITDKVKNLSSGDKISISVTNTAKEGYNFDGRIKLIALVFAYNDMDDDKINYWLNIGQSWTQSTRSNLINTRNFNEDYDKVTFENIALSTYNGLCRINNKLIYDPLYEFQGSYFIDNIWDITNHFEVGKDTNFSYRASSNGYGSFKSNIQLLKTSKYSYNVSVSVIPPYKDTIFAGVPNNLTMDIFSDKTFDAHVKVYDNNVLVYNETVGLNAGIINKVYFLDSKIRPITANTVNGADNDYENYVVIIEDNNNDVLNSANVSYKILYNGNLGKNLAYPSSNLTVNRFYDITGDVFVLNQDASKYMGTGVTSSESIFNVTSNDTAEALIYIPYNWDKITTGDFDLWNTTFNGYIITPVASYRDQSNLGNYGRYGYGLVVYNVSNFIKYGENTLILNKNAGRCAVYPSSLVILTNSTESKIYKEIYICEDADLLAKQSNLETGSYSFIDVNTDNIVNSTLYVFAAGAQNGEANIIINNKSYENVWNGTSSSTDYSTFDLTNSLLKRNTVYFQSLSSTILSLHNILVNEFEKTTPMLNIISKDITVGDNLTLTVELSENANGSISIDGYYVEKVENGKATFKIPNLTVGNYTFIIKYSGDNKHNPSSANCSVKVKAKPMIIIEAENVTKYYGGSERFKIKVTDSDNNPISGQIVEINIGGRYYNKTTNANGTATAPLGLNSGVYNVTVNVNSTVVNAIAVIKSTVEGSDVLMIYRNGSQYMAVFRDSEGNYLAEGSEIEFNINGVLYNRNVRANGTARLNINLEQGKYVITALNTKTGERCSNNITVLSNIIENGDITKYYRNGTQYKVKILGKDGMPIGSGKNVTFNINGVFYTRTTNNQSIAKLNINLQPGNYVITAEYNRCRVSNNIRVLPVLSAKDLTKNYGSSDQFVARLVNGQGNPLSGVKVSFNINGVFYERTTNMDGQAKLNIKLQSGEYIITSSYNGANIASKVIVV